jgi:hypothetical protein
LPIKCVESLPHTGHDEDFLVSGNTVLHQADVIEDADGPLLTMFRPTSRVR